MSLAKVVTHHEKKSDAARLFEEDHVAAVGWAEVGDLTGKSRDEIFTTLKQKHRNWSNYEIGKAASELYAFKENVREGYMIIAYKGDNRIALVGEVERGYEYNVKNRVGDPNGEIRYPNQVGVNWWAKPRDFLRSSFPPSLSEWVSRQGAVAIMSYDLVRFRQILERIVAKDSKSGIKNVISIRTNQIGPFLPFPLPGVADQVKSLRQQVS